MYPDFTFRFSYDKINQKYFLEEENMKLEKELTGKRIIIRSCEKSDLAFYKSMWLDPENGKYMIDPEKEFANEEYLEALSKLDSDEDGYYLTVILHSGEPIGSFCAFPENGGKVFDIGYCIHKKYWKQGFGSEALSIMIDWISSRGAEKITGEVAVENIASCKLLEKFGFVPEKETEFKKYNMDIKFKSYIYAKEL